MLENTKEYVLLFVLVCWPEISSVFFRIVPENWGELSNIAGSKYFSDIYMLRARLKSNS
jgi:hypothetical protein